MSFVLRTTQPYFRSMSPLDILKTTALLLTLYSGEPLTLILQHALVCNNSNYVTIRWPSTLRQFARVVFLAGTYPSPVGPGIILSDYLLPFLSIDPTLR